MKLIVETESDKVLGAHMVGEHSGEILQAMAVAIQCGAKKKDLDGTFGIRPTTAEGVRPDAKRDSLCKTVGYLRATIRCGP